jgi:signal transduction histidine kinase/class 3 adenylate cyclase
MSTESSYSSGWRMQFCCLFFFLFSLWFLQPLKAQSNTFTITELKDEYDLNDHIQILTDSENKLEINSVISGLTDNEFQSYDPNQELNSKWTYWLKVSIDNQMPGSSILRNWILFVGDLDLLEVYKVSNSGTILDTLQSGTLYSSNYKSLKIGNKFNRVKINFGEEYPVHLFIKISRINHQSMSIDLKLNKYDYYQSWDYIKETRWQWCFLGFFATMIIFNLLFYQGTSDKAFLYHALFILGVFTFILEFFAVTHDLFFVSTNPILKQIIDYSGIAIMDIAYYQFIRYYLNLKSLLPYWDKIFRWLIFLKIAVFAFVIIHYYFFINVPFTDKIVAYFLSSQYFVVAIFLIPVFKTKDKKGIFLIIGSLFIFLGILFNAIRVIQGVEIIIMPTLVGMTGEILMFSFGLGFRMKELKDMALEEERKTIFKLIQIDKLKNQFLANTSHELKTPLHGIIGLSEKLVENENNSEKREDLSLIINSGKRLNNLINDILDFSKLKNHELTLNIKSVDLKILVQIVIKMVQPLLTDKKLKIINSIPEKLPRVLADENRLQQILYNLIYNAIKFTEQGYVQLDAKLKDSMMEVLIIDTGIGIEESKKEIIFEEFQQADGSISREYSGSGLGLSISKQLIELQGGEISLESVSGEGSVFRFTIPLQSDNILEDVPTQFETETKPFMDISQPIESGTEDIPNAKNEIFEASTSNTLFNILIVDDEPINRQVLRGHLKDPIFRITSVANGHEAIEIINTNDQIDLVLLDLMMPRMSGYEVCKIIREKYLPSEMPVIMVTAKNQMNDLLEGFKVGANDYISKPFTRDEFLARVKTQLNLYSINKAAGRFVPSDFIRALGRETITEVMLGDHVQKKVTVLFSDIRGYTSLAEKMKLEENFDFVMDHVAEMGPIIFGNKGFVNQYLGDSIMAIFANNPEDALKASIAMQKNITQRNKQISVKEYEMNVGIGFHTGNLMMGIIGDKYHSKPVTIADTVNIASRIESLTKYFGTNILLSGSSINGMSEADQFDFRFIGKVQMKGKSRPIEIYECINGDPEEVFIKKKESIDQFNEAIECYLSKDFAKAIATFQAILGKNPSDSVSTYFQKKSAELISNGIPDGWTGIEIMDKK